MTLRLLSGLPSNFVAVALTIGFTYAAHALVWWAAVLGALRLGGRSPAARHRLWKTALLGPLATAPIAALAPWTFEPAVARRLVSAPRTLGLDVGASGSAWPSWLALGLGVAMVVGLLRFGIAFVRLRRRLRHRTPVRDARLVAHLEGVCVRAGLSQVRLTESAELGGPLVLGTRELCVPRSQLQHLGEDELVAVLAHELAHLERGDGVWFPVVGLLQSALWMQPLNHWIATRFRETAELACDDRAVALSGERTGLARALVRLAEGALGAEQSRLVPAVASAPGGLRARVERLLEPVAGPPLAPAGGTGRSAGTYSLVMCALAALVFSVRVTPSAGLERGSSAAAASSERLVELVERDRELQRQLARASEWSEAHADDRAFAAWKDAVEQELRHVRAEATWTEANLGTDARGHLTAR